MTMLKMLYLSIYVPIYPSNFHTYVLLACASTIDVSSARDGLNVSGKKSIPAQSPTLTREICIHHEFMGDI